MPVIDVAIGEDYIKLVAKIGSFTEEVTGVNIIDAYFGPKNLLPEKVATGRSPDKILSDLDALCVKAKEIDARLRRIVITSNLESLKVVVRWLSGENIPFLRLIEGIYGMTPFKFGQKEMCKVRQIVEDRCTSLSGPSVSEKIMKWEEESRVSGEALKKLIDTEIKKHTEEIRRLFERRVFIHLPSRIENEGVVYETVTGVPWTAYNYYKGNYLSVNVFNIDRPLGRYGLVWTTCHEYEHHVANLFRERYYRENRSSDLAAVIYHTKGDVISEGTADCARDFIGLQIGGAYSELLESLGSLRSMIGLNAAYMLNVENVDDETAAEYMASEGFTKIEEARKRVSPFKPLTSDGKPNFFTPYAYNYFIGKRDYVLPTFKRAQKKGRLEEFFQTLYLNPYSRSTATWRTAFSDLCL